MGDIECVVVGPAGGGVGRGREGGVAAGPRGATAAGGVGGVGRRGGGGGGGGGGGDRGILRSLFDSISLLNFTTISLVLGQLSSLIEFFLIRRIKILRSKVYDLTIQSRSKPTEFWIPYVEESRHPPIDKAHRRVAKRRWYRTITTPIFRLIILKVLLLPLSFVPFLNTIVSSFLTSLTLSEKLLEPYFEVKRMTKLERALFVVERENQLRWLGFFAAGLERIPLLGILFSISNRISFAMFAHDLEKRQHLVKDAIIPQSSEPYVSKSTFIESDLPPDAIGNFPKKKLS